MCIQEQDDIKELIALINSSVNAEKIYLFGSYAYGNPTKTSDFDIYVVLSDNSVRPLEARRKIYKSLLSKNMEKPVDILANYSSVFHQLSKLPSLERTIVSKGVVIYE